MTISFVQKSFPYSHWEFGDIKTGDKLRLVPDRGGLITEWYSNGREVLYFDLDRFRQKDKSIRGGIPILFPICGDLKDENLKIPGKGHFTIRQHGFARNMPWEIKLLDSHEGVCLSLSDTEITRRMFPYKFLIDLEIRLKRNMLLISSNIFNLSDEKMPFTFGLHPYFNVTDIEKTYIEGLPLKCIDQMTMSNVETKSQLSKLFDGVDFLAHSKGPVALIDLIANHRVEIHQTQPMDLTVVWTDPPRSMVCIEPWTSPRQALISGERCLFLEPGSKQKLESFFVSS